MNIALEYAYAGRDWVVDRIIKGILGSHREWSVHNNHNYASRETHLARWDWPVEHAEQTQEYIVHRKGATPAFPGQRGFVGATMGEDAVIVEGVFTDSAMWDALYSTVHGAGRVMSRTAAAGKVKVRKTWRCGHRDCSAHGMPQPAARRLNDGQNPPCDVCGRRLHLHKFEERIREGAVNWPAAQAQLAAKGIYLVGGGADEAPEAYKRLSEVLIHHQGAIKVVHNLKVLGVAMAGPDTVDPYKD